MENKTERAEAARDLFLITSTKTCWKGSSRSKQIWRLFNTWGTFWDSQLRCNRVLCAAFVHFWPYLYHFWAPNYTVTACCVLRSFISYHICTIFKLPTRGNQVLCAEFVHFLPYLHRFCAPNYAVTACCVQSSIISYHICIIFGFPTTR